MNKRRHTTGRDEANRKRRKSAASPTAESEQCAKEEKSTSANTFPFLSLPAELRLLIYSFLLTDTNPLLFGTRVRAHRRQVRLVSLLVAGPNYDPHKPQNPQFHVDEAPSFCLSILRTCKAVHAEATSILYGNTLHFPSTSIFFQFLAEVGPRTRSRLTNATIQDWGRNGGYGGSAQKLANHAAFSLLVGAEKLRRLELDCYLDSRAGMEGKAKNFWRAAEFWIDWVIREKGEDALREILVLGKGFWNRAKESSTAKEKFIQVLVRMNGPVRT